MRLMSTRVSIECVNKFSGVSDAVLESSRHCGAGVMITGCETAIFNSERLIIPLPTRPIPHTFQSFSLIILPPPMPKARTITSEKRKANAIKEAAKIAARKAVLDQRNKPVDERKSIRQIAREFGVDHSVLSRLAKGQPTMGEFNAGKQLLTPAEERTIVDFLIGMGKRGFPLTHRMIMEKAYHILSAKFGPTVEIGQLWVTRFLHRHSRLSIYRATPLEQNRAIGMNPEAYKDYVETVDELFTLHNPPPSNILGMDEVGINSGIFSRQLMVGEAGQRHQHLQKNGERKNTTCIETIVGDGTVLRPTVIFKGKYRMSSWSEVNPDNAK